MASTADDNQYLEVDLKIIHNITKVVLQGSGKAANAWTKQFKVLLYISVTYYSYVI